MTAKKTHNDIDRLNDLLENTNTTIAQVRQGREAKMSKERSEQQLVDVFEVNITPVETVPPSPLGNLRDLAPQREAEPSTEHLCDEEKG
jgi:hypothetical protein